jgi:FAD/FMN-containing dehydrogenase
MTDSTGDGFSARSLREGFSGPVLAAGEPGYDDARSVFNSMIDRRPALIAQCETNDDVLAALGFAREHRLAIAVRGGGHSVAGSSVGDGAMVIDLRRMSSVEVDPDRRTARVAGGATWGDVDRVCQPHGLATTGGRVSTTGVAGLTLGGGSGWFERKFGLACDSLLSVEVINADGRTVIATEAENPELFWALHGGGGNFGIATELVLRLQPLPAATLGMLLWTSETGPEVVRRFRDLIAGGAPDELGGSAVYLVGPPEEFVPEHLVGKLVVAVVVVFAGTDTAARDAITPLLELRPDGEMIAELPYAEIQSALDDPPGYRNYWSAEHLAELPDAAIDLFCARADHMVVPSPSQQHVLPWGGAVTRQSSDWPLPHRRAAWVVHPFGLWEDPADDKRGIAWSKALCTDMKPFATGDVYLNFIGDEGENRVIAGFGPENYKRLAAVKAEYDPENVFRLNHNIKPTTSS